MRQTTNLAGVVHHDADIPQRRVSDKFLLAPRLARHASWVRPLLVIVGIFLTAQQPVSSEEPMSNVCIAVFDHRATGGQGAQVDGLVDGLREHGYDVHRITDLQPLTLGAFDIIYLSDMHKPGNVHQHWREGLRAYVKAGGSVLQTWHHHIFREVAVGVERVYHSRAMTMRPDHPAVDGIIDFRASFRDHIVERVGPQGKVLMENEQGQPVAVAGQLGQGKVISTGLALSIPNGNASVPPRGDEAKLLKQFLAWLEPSVPPRQRMERLIEKPQLHVTPSSALVVAGRPAEFRVSAAHPDGAAISVHCEEANVQPASGPRADMALQNALARHYRITVRTQAGANGQQQIQVRARLGTATLAQTVSVESVHAKAPQDEVRGVWLHVRPDRHPKDVMPELKRLGINMAVLRIAGGTAAFYASKVQPDVQDPLAPDGDWLAEAVHHAHANGIEIPVAVQGIECTVLFQLIVDPAGIPET